MSKLESGIVSNEHYEFLQLNQVGRLSERVSKVVDAEEQSLRQFNAELLQKIGEYRKKNLELAASENELRAKLAQQTKLAGDRERDQTLTYENEIARLNRALEDERRSVSESNDDWSRRLAKLSDDGWAQGLENENLKRLQNDIEKKLEHYQLELDRGKDLAKSVEASRERESQMMTAYEALRLEYANIDRCYNESNTALMKIQSEMRERYQQHETELQELTTYLETKAAQDSALIRDENRKLKEQLNVRDQRLDQDRQALHQWKEQLTQLDLYLKRFAEKLQGSKAEMIRLTKSLEAELQFAVTHPFTDYLDMANSELAQINQQLATVSSMSPLKAKLETRLQQTTNHRDEIQSVLNKSGEQMTAHTKAVQTVLRTLEFLN